GNVGIAHVRLARRTRIAGGDDDFSHAPGLGKFPCQCMFAATAANDEELHKAGIGDWGFGIWSTQSVPSDTRRIPVARVPGEHGSRSSIESSLVMPALLRISNPKSRISAQCLKCRTPVNTIAMSFASAAAITSASRME